MPATLMFVCGKMAAGASTLSRQLAERANAVLLVRQHFLATLLPGEIVDIPAFVERYARVKAALATHIRALLGKDVSVVLDFGGSTRTQRAWFRELGLRPTTRGSRGSAMSGID